MGEWWGRGWRIGWRIHHTAYEMNLIPLVSSNLWAARISPRLPSLMRSESDTPWFWYFFATETTKRRLERTNLSSASSFPCLMRWASDTSSSRVISGYWLISRRYWSSDPSSNEARFAVFSCMAQSPPLGADDPARLPLSSPEPTAGLGRSHLDVDRLGGDRPETVPANTGQPGKRVVRLPVVAEVGQEAPSFDRHLVDVPPIPRVRRVVAIIPQHEVLAARHAERARGDAGGAVAPRGDGAADEVGPLPVELRVVHVVRRIDPLDVGLPERLAVHPDLPATHLHGVPRDADHAFDIIELGVLGEGEHNDVAAARRFQAGQARHGTRHLPALHHPVHPEKVPHAPGALPAAAGELGS